MPVLARTMEAMGLSTILVTNMPFWAEKMGVPRTLAVEYPFGHMLGQPHNVEQQREVIQEALGVLATARVPGTIVHSSEKWPVVQKETLRKWQPEKPSPVMEAMRPHVIKLLRERRRST